MIKCKKFEDIQAIWNVKGNGKTNLGAVKKIKSRFEEIKPQSAVAFHMDHLCAWSVPECLNFTSVAGIYSFGTWFTEAHIEVNGDDSITAIPYRKKVFIYAAGITASRWLLKTVVDIIFIYHLLHWLVKVLRKIQKDNYSFVYPNQPVS